MMLTDFTELKKIHEKFYKDEFEFPDFARFLFSFVVTDNNGIISAGGIRLIPEAILITDKDRSVRIRKAALLSILTALAFITDKEGYDQIHAFIQDRSWEKHLKKMGFQDCKGHALYLNL